MQDTLTLAVCNFLVPEISEIISNGDYPDVKLISYAATCSANSGARKSIENNIKRLELEQSDLIVIGSTCVDDVNEISVNYNYRFINLTQCFEPLVNNDIIFHYISNGYYIVTNGWLKKLEVHKQGWGFNKKEEAIAFFRESMKKILFPDTKIPGDYKQNLVELSDYMGIPYEILPVGLEKRIFGDLEDIAMKLNAPGGDGPRFLPVSGEVFTEIDAIAMLTGLETELVAAGGVCGAEGSIWLAVSGNAEQIEAAEEILKSVRKEPLFEL